MDTLEQHASIDELSIRAAQQTGQSPGPFREFLEVANEAHRRADDDQRRLMRQLAHTLPTPQEATSGIRQIMGWEVG